MPRREAGAVASRHARILTFALACLAAACSLAPAGVSATATGAARQPAPSAAAFRAARATWERLGRALARGDRAGAMRELTPSARARYGAQIEEMLAARHFDAARFGVVRKVTLTGERYATLTLARQKENGTYGYEVLLVRGDDGRWRVDRM